MSDDFSEWVSKVQQWNDATKIIPALVKEDIIKSRIELDTPRSGFKTTLSDPFSIQYSLGYKDRPTSLSYDMIKRVVKQLSVLGAILNTRCSQVAAFSVPYHNTKSLGYAIKLKDQHRAPSRGEKQKIKELEEYIARCGSKEENPHNIYKRDNFETFLRKITRDSLMYDQLCAEIVPDRRGLPFEFMAVDAATIRLASKDTVFGGPDETYHHRPPITEDQYWKQQGTRSPFKAMKLFSQDPKERPDFIQIVNGQIENVYTKDELVFGIRNPRTDIYAQGYGYSEIEQLITIITAHLNAEEYNRRIFTTGTNNKGVINFKGDNLTADQLEGFRREWRANMEGVANAHRVAIMQAENGVEWIDMLKSNSDMEYAGWLEYLLKISCAVYLIDPEELHFSLGNGGQAQPLFESNNEYKLKASRDKGLKPLLRFIAQLINDNIVARIDDKFVFDFVGLDELSEQEKHELRKDEVTTYKTLNEIRRAEDLPDLEDGDTVLNPTYLQAKQIRVQQEQQEQQSQGDQGGVQPVDQPQGQQREQDNSNTPQYSDGFTKSQGKYIEIDLDSWKTRVRR